MSLQGWWVVAVWAAGILLAGAPGAFAHVPDSPGDGSDAAAVAIERGAASESDQETLEEDNVDLPELFAFEGAIGLPAQPVLPHLEAKVTLVRVAGAPD